MNSLARQAVRLYPRTDYTSRQAVNALRRGWIRQIQYLGDKWLLAIPIHKKQAGYIDPDVAVFVMVVVCALVGASI